MCARFLVLEVGFSDDGHSKVLRALRQTQSHAQSRSDACADHVQGEISINLQGEWAATQVDPGNYIHLIQLPPLFDSPPSSSDSPFINPASSPPCSHPFSESSITLSISSTTLLIVHPDVLIPVTRVGESFPCVRRSVLSERVRGGGQGSRAALHGTLAHDLFERALTHGEFTADVMSADIEDILTANIIGLYGADETEMEAREFLVSVLPDMVRWGEMYMRQRACSCDHSSDASVSSSSSSSPCSSSSSSSCRFCCPGCMGGEVTCDGGGMTVRACVSELLCTEDNLVSPRLGLKGKLDATVRVRVSHPKPRVLQHVPPTRAVTDVKNNNVCGSQRRSPQSFGVSGSIRQPLKRCFSTPSTPSSSPPSSSFPAPLSSPSSSSASSPSSSCRNGHVTPSCEHVTESHVVPFELKTGRVTTIGHHAQVLLYALMLQER